MQSDRFAKVMRCGTAVMLASTLALPSYAFAQDDDESPGDVSQEELAVQDGGATDERVTGSVQADPAVAASDDVQDDDQSTDEGSSDQGSVFVDGTAADDDDGNVTIIVQLEEQETTQFNPFSFLFSSTAESRHNQFKNKIKELAADQADQGEVNPVESVLSLFSADEEAGSVEDVHDYYNVIDGFAIKAPASTLEGILALDGVKHAFIEQEYAVPADQEADTDYKNQNALDITGADQVDEEGDGQVIVVIDSALDTDHEAFSGDLDDSLVAYGQDSMAAAKSSLSGGGSGAAYISEKIPFAYDYADNDAEVNPGIDGLEHGTHVAGIATANGGDQIRGAAPNAQLIMMKVASDSTGSIYDSAVLAALDDAAALNVDAVNMSFGSDVGFSDEGTKTYSDAIKVLEDGGATVNVSAGNSFSSAYENQSGEDLPYATDPDSGVISSPSGVSSALSVASMNADAVVSTVSSFSDAAGNQIGYTEVTGPNGTTASSFSNVADGTYEYVWGGIGRNDYGGEDLDGDVNGQRLDGKIVIMRGHGVWSVTGQQTPYSRAIANYSEKGAAAIIIYDEDLPELTTISYEGDGWYEGDGSPAIFIAKADAESLLAADSKTITVQQGQVLPGDADDSYYTMSSFSSWGVTPDLKLKPEIAAPSGNIYSSVLNDQYTYMSGTSMASPQLSGLSVLVKQHVEEDERYASLTDDERADIVTQLLMSTAEPLADPDEEGSYYSPRQQGAGVANVVAATETDVYASVEGATNESRPKADLGESSDGTWSFTVTLHNVGSEDRRFTPDTAALSEIVSDGLFQQQSQNWTGEGIAVAYSGSAYDSSTGTVTVPAGATASYTVSITCEEAFKTAAQAAPNGTFVDGFARLIAQDDGVDLSVPFMGFYGDWSTASVFDDSIDGDYHAFGTTFVDADKGTLLGVNPLIEDAKTDRSYVKRDRMVLSNSAFFSARTTMASLTGLLRNVDSLTYEVTGPDGDSLGSETYDYVPKTTYKSNYSMFAHAEAFLNGGPTLDLSKADSPEGTYTFTQTATTSGPTPEEQTQSYEIEYDLTAPTISEVEYQTLGEDGATLSFTVTDNTYIAAIDFFDPDTVGPTPYSNFYRVLVSDDDLAGTDDQGNHVYHVTANVSDIKAAWGTTEEIPSLVAAYAWDYGLNASSRTDAVLTPVAATSVSLASDSVTIVPGQQISLTAALDPIDTTDARLVWESSDEKVFTVDADGTLTGVAAGSADVTVSVANRPELTDSATVTVSAIPDSVGILLSSDAIRVAPQSTADITALLSGSLDGQVVSWSSDNEEVATVQASAEDSSQAVVSGGYQIGDATLTASISTAQGAVKTATMTVQNRSVDYDDFVIDEAGVLQGYRGVKSSLVIPNDVVAIGEGAFDGDITVSSVVIPASVQKIGARAFARLYEDSGSGASTKGTAKTITFEDTDEHPSQLTEIGDSAFSNGGVTGTVILPNSVTKLGWGVFEACMSLEKVVLPVGLTEIPGRTFYRCVALVDVTISDKVTSIGDEAFRKTMANTALNLNGTEPGAATTGLPSALETLGDATFAESFLSGDVQIVLPAGLKRLESSTFSSARGITSIVLNEGLESIGRYALNNTSIESLVIPDSMTEIEDDVFMNMPFLKEVTLGRTVSADSMTGAFSWCFALERINVPDDAVNFAQKDGVLYSKDLSTLVYFPTARTGTFAIPEGTTTIASYAFEDTSLDALELPDSLQNIAPYSLSRGMTVNEQVIGGFDVLDFGSNVRSIGRDAFRQQFYTDDSRNAGFTPNHLIVRGGNDESYEDTRGNSGQTAYFGTGMTSLDFSQSGAPALLVVSEDIESLDLSGNASNSEALTMYVPADTSGAQVVSAALEAIGANPTTQMKDYEPLEMSVLATATPTPGATVTVSAVASGGVEGAKEYRFIQMNSDGTETVVSDWSATALIDWTMPADGMILRAEARDATYVTAEDTLGAVAAPVIVTNLDTAPVSLTVGQQAPTLSVAAQATDGATLAYQWYEDGALLEGATSSSFIPPSDTAGQHEYHCVITATKAGISNVATSETATVRVYGQAQSPLISTDLPASVPAEQGQAVTLSIEAVSPDGGTLSCQWYQDGQKIVGATGASYAPGTGSLGQHSYYVVVTNTTAVGETAQTTSATAVVTVSVALNLSALNDAISQVDSLVASDYTAESWNALQDCLTAARAILADADATQAQVDEALAGLQAARESLVSAAGGNEEGQHGGTGNDDSGSDGTKGAQEKAGSSQNSSQLVKTGDSVAVAMTVAVAGVIGGSLALAAVVRRRRLPNDQAGPRL